MALWPYGKFCTLFLGYFWSVWFSSQFVKGTLVSFAPCHSNGLPTFALGQCFLKETRNLSPCASLMQQLLPAQCPNHLDYSNLHRHTNLLNRDLTFRATDVQDKLLYPPTARKFLRGSDGTCGLSCKGQFIVIISRIIN